MAFNLLYGTFYFRVSWSSIVIVYDLCLFDYSILSFSRVVWTGCCTGYVKTSFLPGSTPKKSLFHFSTWIIWCHHLLIVLWIVNGSWTFVVDVTLLCSINYLLAYMIGLCTLLTFIPNLCECPGLYVYVFECFLDKYGFFLIECTFCVAELWTHGVFWYCAFYIST